MSHLAVPRVGRHGELHLCSFEARWERRDQRPRLLRPRLTSNSEGRGGGDACGSRDPAEVARPPSPRGGLPKEGSRREGRGQPNGGRARGAGRSFAKTARSPERRRDRASGTSNHRQLPRRPDLVCRGVWEHSSSRPRVPRWRPALLRRSTRSRRPLGQVRQRQRKLRQPVLCARLRGVRARRDRCAPGRPGEGRRTRI